METTFYDDHQHYRSKEEIKMLKRTMTLDLESPTSRTSKKQKFSTLLTSPDLNMLKLASPELERLIIAQNGLVTTTPTPTQFLFPKNVTEEQEQYARGFVDALVQLHQTTPALGVTHLIQSDSSDIVTSTSSSVPSTLGIIIEPHVTSFPPTSSVNSAYVPVTSAPSYCFPASVKEEPQTVPSLGVTPPLSPINMENQERIKLERKRLRNRIAASKCRRRKLERIARLEDKVNLLKGENSDLSNVATRLREQVCQLKQQVMDHVKSGCQIMITHSF